MTTRITLDAQHFGAAESVLHESAEGRVAAFRYASGVEALRVTTDRVELVVLPFYGQQIWSYRVDGEDLTMVSPVPEPTGAAFFGDSYGCFLMHCGLTGMGGPGPDDEHAPHGELPTARYDEAWVEIGDGLRLAGRYRHTAASLDYSFTPTLVVKPGSPSVELSYLIENLSDEPLSYQYLCHVNWAIFTAGRLEQPASLRLDSFVVVPDPTQDAETARYVLGVTKHPATGNEVDPSLHIQPEYVAIVKPLPDAHGWAHFLQRRPDGRAAWVGYDTAHLPWAVRWIASTADRKAGGFCLPSTGHHLGRRSSADQGMLQQIPAHESHLGRISFGLLDAAETDRRSAEITRALA